MQKQNVEAECGGKNKVSFIEIITSVLLFCSYASAQSVFDEIESSSSKKNGYGVVKSPSDRKFRSGRSDRKFRSGRSDRVNFAVVAVIANFAVVAVIANFAVVVNLPMIASKKKLLRLKVLGS